MSAARSQERGFTLMELLVASIAGLFVILAAFLLSRGATRLFAAEGRVANTQLNLRLGVDRLRADLERAGFMTTPNVRLDPDVCPDPNTLGIAARLQSIYLQLGSAGTGAIDAPLSASQGLHPDRITITGNFATTDTYLAADIAPSASGGGWDIVLQTGFASTARLLESSEGGSALATMQSVFGTGRVLRVRNDLGSSQFLVIQGASIGAGGRPIVTAAPTPAYTSVTGTTVVKRCGGRGGCIGCEINPVHIVRYSVRSLASNAAFSWAYPDGGGVGDVNKYDLVREELAPNGTVIPGTEEIVAEYAVDLAFAFSVDTSAAMAPGAAWTEPNLLNLPFGHADNATWGGDVLTNNPTIRPQRIRTIRYRLTTRTRFPEYETAADDGGPGLLRYRLGSDRFARARTVTGEIALVNQQGIRW